MTRGTKRTVASAAVALAMVLWGSRPATAEIPIVQYDGWRLSTDGRVNTFFSVAEGTGIPQGQPGNNPGAGTPDTSDLGGGLHSARIRNGLMMSILGFTGQKEISPNLKVTTRVGLWMNITGTRTKNNFAQMDPRELYGKIEGRWGSLLAGSDLALFGRGAILLDAQIAHDYGLGYPCAIRDASGGACGMVGFGAPFPGFEPGLIYATPNVGGVQVSLGIYDPATIGNATLDRAPLPRFEAEGKFEFRQTFRVFGSGFWQVLEGTPPGGAMPRNLHTNAWGAQAGAMVAVGPVMLGGAAYQGAGFSPITYVDESTVAADSAGVLRDSRGAFGLAAVLVNALHLKVAGGMGVWQLDKNKNDAGPTISAPDPNDPNLTIVRANNPALIKQNLGMTLGVYQTTGPVHFSLEYFRAQHTWYDMGVANAVDPMMNAIVTPRQAVNFITAGMTVAW